MAHPRSTVQVASGLSSEEGAAARLSQPTAGAVSTISGLCSPPAETASSKTPNINSMALWPLSTRPLEASTCVLVLPQPPLYWSLCFHPDVLLSNNPDFSA